MTTVTEQRATKPVHDGADGPMFHIYGPGDHALVTLTALCGHRRPPSPEIPRPMVRGTHDCSRCWEFVSGK